MYIEIQNKALEAIENSIKELNAKGYSKTEIEDFIQGLIENLENIDFDYLED